LEDLAGLHIPPIAQDMPDFRTGVGLRHHARTLKRLAPHAENCMDMLKKGYAGITNAKQGFGNT
jgi:hypothetical protein